MEPFATIDDKYVGLGGGLPALTSLDELLDLPRSKIAEMDRNLHSPSQRKDAYLDLYVTGHPCPSWRQVAVALRGVRLPHQAAIVESSYVQGTRIMPMHLLSVIVKGFMTKHNTGTFPVTFNLLCVQI